MNALLRISRLLDLPSRALNRWLRWLVLALLLVQLAVVVLRYLFATSFIALQEGVIYLHATVFMLAFAAAYLIDGHVRVDILYGRWGPRARAGVELATILLGVLPFCAVLLWAGWPFVAAAWATREGALFYGGLPWVWLLKSLLVALPLLLLLQGLAILLRAIAVLGGAEVALFERERRE